MNAKKPRELSADLRDIGKIGEQMASLAKKLRALEAVEKMEGIQVHKCGADGEIVAVTLTPFITIEVSHPRMGTLCAALHSEPAWHYILEAVGAERAALRIEAAELRREICKLSEARPDPESGG